MAKASEQGTSRTLLERLRRSPADQAAWCDFVDRYAPKVNGWCRRWGLQPTEAEDVCQEVLLRLAEKMLTFRYDPRGSFRAWLKTLTRHAWSDFVEKRRRPGAGAGSSQVLEILQSVEARAELERLEDVFDRELLEEAMARVRPRVMPRTWEAFRLLALEGWPGARVAEYLGMQVAAVFMARSNVQKMLRRECHRLLHDTGPEGEGQES
jgi:RNA polymerase sigma-70 factor (ECF subfamily)